MALPPEEIEKRIHRALRDLPTRSAPVTLEARVLAEIQRRAALSWWRRPPTHWPAPARAAFFALSAAVATVLVCGLHTLAHGTLAAGIARTFWQSFALSEPLRSAGAAIFRAADASFNSVPRPWLYGTLTVLAACYATVIGVGAAAYRAFSKKA